MKAAVVTRYGAPDVISLKELDRPSCGPKELLVRVNATAVTIADARIRGFDFPGGFGPIGRLIFGFTKPRRAVLGSAYSGTVESVGRSVTGFNVGDEVCGMTGLKMGTHAEYAAVPAAKAVLKPAKVSHDEAAGLLFGAATAHTYLTVKTQLKPGMSVLINGGSGAVGTAAIQLAALAGAEVTAVASTPNLELLKSLGAKHTIDYTKQPLTSSLGKFDAVLDTVGNISIESGKSLLAEGGVLLLVASSLGETMRARGPVKAGPAAEDPAAFAELLELVAKDKLRVVLDATLPLTEIVQAHRRIDSGRKVGNIVVHP